MSESALKHLFGKKLLARMAAAITEVYPVFDSRRFNKLMPELETLEMKQRVRHLREELRRQLPKDFAKAVRILLKSTATNSLSGFDLWPYTEFIQTYGLDHLELSLDALKKITPLFTSEFAVRPFLRFHSELTLKYLLACTQDKIPMCVRWASEGSRPRLPWGERLQDFIKDPLMTLPILEALKWDEGFVRAPRVWPTI